MKEGSLGRIKRNELPLIRTDYPPPMKKANLEGQAKTPLLPPEVHHAERCNRKAGGIESGRVGESEASDQKGRNTRLALGRDAWAEEGDRYSFSRPQTDPLMDRGSSCVEYATPDSLWTGIITFENIDSSLHRALREGHRRAAHSSKNYTHRMKVTGPRRESHRFFVIVFPISQLFLFRGLSRMRKIQSLLTLMLA